MGTANRHKMSDAVYAKVLAAVLATLGQAGVGWGSPTPAPAVTAATPGKDGADEVWLGMDSTELIAFGAGLGGLCVCMTCCMVLRVRAGTRKRRRKKANRAAVEIARRAQVSEADTPTAIAALNAAEKNAEHAAINPMLEIDDDPIDGEGAGRSTTRESTTGESEYFESVGDAAKITGSEPPPSRS